jgi:hypothetical protein
VNLGGEPERDDSGLPPVDIVVPDDARELDRDVQAYRRELRALRRHQRRMRWHGPVTRDGIILPLLASCLVLALIAGTLLTFFTARPGGEPAAGRSPAAASSSRPPGTASPPAASPPPATSPPDSPRAVLSPVPFPAKTDIRVAGQPASYAELTDSTVLALIPAACGCATVLAELVRQAGAAHVIVYLVGGGKLAPVTEVTALAVQAKTRSGTPVADDAAGTLAGTYLRAGGTSAGSAPTALLVAQDGTVTVASALHAGFQLGNELATLGHQPAG